MEHTASASIVASSLSISATASVTAVGSVTLHPAYISTSGTGVVSPPPLEIDVADTVGVDDERDVKPLPLTSTELLAYIKGLYEISKQLQQLAVKLGEENPVLAWTLKIIAAYLLIQALRQF